MALLRRFCALTAADRGLIVQAAAWFVAIRIALRVLSFASVARYAERRHEGRPVDRSAQASRIGWATGAVARRLAPPRSCLAQALTAQVMLGGRGRPAMVRFGVQRDARGVMQAHAWLESDGEVLVGGEGLEVYRELRDRSREPS